MLPAQSEAALVLLLRSGDYSVAGLLFAASLGNILGSIVNYLLGWWAESFHDRNWFPVKEKSLERSKHWYRRCGRWSLLLSWAPVIGDPITVAAGFLREPFWSFLLLVTIAKVGRYLAVACLALNWI
ncbi:MAG: YqaA family protein [Rhizobiaceae bacterium]